MFDQPQQQQTLATRIAAAIAEQTAWMTAEREARRQQWEREERLGQLQDSRVTGWEELADTIAVERRHGQHALER
ncbi:hypothetical protein [Geminicoccus flavidas]|uniref:hypothetical protein n=1 Tax=Geminicoccus flavidas TaxID=2506407 RepID=UPI001357232D|nr:hypothetical protein [Geminicoccus flavidas]